MLLQGIVHQGWQGLTFLAMDLMEPFGMEYVTAVEIAIRIEKFRFGLNLMGKQMDDTKLLKTNDKQQNKPLRMLFVECITI